jgi:predicted N-acyltransferase
MRVTALPNLESVPPDQWNLLAGDDPFLQHEFLLALERAGCVGGDSGWEPRHIALHAEGSSRLIGAVPLYLKHHSYGEYVFDWAWADAYVRSGREYYPKLVAAVPFTPATGKRLLVADTDRDEVAALLIEATREVADATGASSLHWLFPAATDLDLLTKHDLLARTGCQFHWSNPGYSDFEDFLSGMTAHKRYNIRRERRRVREADVTAEVLQGAAISSELWDVVTGSIARRFARTAGSRT